MISKAIIEQMSPNANALSKGKALSDDKAFSELKRNAESTVFWADCAGSGKKPYKTSIDITDSTKLPVCRCSCPSRQFPCKHAIGLMYEIVKASKFEVDSLPENLAEKIATKAEKNVNKTESTNTKVKKPSKKALEAQQKKIELQLQGLELAKKAIDEVMSAGLGTLTGTSSSKFKELSVELRNYELSSQHVTGLQLIFNRIAFIAEELQSLKSSNRTEENQRYMAEVLKYLISANTLIRKGKLFLSSRLSSNLNEAQDFSEDDNILFEELGGIWKLKDLENIKSYQDNAHLLQLSFFSEHDDVKGADMEKACYLNLDTKEICVDLNIRPDSVNDTYLKYGIKCEDIIEIPRMFKYPGTNRVRWDNFSTKAVTPDDIKSISSYAEESISVAVKKFKSYIKNTLHDKELMMLLPVKKIAAIKNEDFLFLEDKEGSRIKIEEIKEKIAFSYCVNKNKSDKKEDYKKRFSSLDTLLKNAKYIKAGDAVFGRMFYDEATREIKFNIYSYVSNKKIIRMF